MTALVFGLLLVFGTAMLRQVLLARGRRGVVAAAAARTGRSGLDPASPLAFVDTQELAWIRRLAHRPGRPQGDPGDEAALRACALR